MNNKKNEIPIYCINKQDAYKRKNFMLQQSQKLGLNLSFVNNQKLDKKFENTNWFNAQVSENALKLYKSKKNNRFWNIAQASCAYTHYLAVKKAYNNNTKSVIIIEDDICFNKNKWLVQRYIKHIPHDADVVFFCFNCGKKVFRKGGILSVLNHFKPKFKNTLKVDHMSCAGFYYLSKKAMEVYLRNQKSDFRTADDVLEIFKDINYSDLNIYIPVLSLGMPYSMLHNNCKGVVCPYSVNLKRHFEPKQPLKSLIRTESF